MLIVMGDLRCGILLDVKTRARAVLATASGTHFVHDGFSDILYVLLPLWAQEFRLPLAQVGLIRTAYTAAMASFQIPAGLLAERWGERRLLAAGTALTACGFIAAGAWAEGFASLLVLLLIAGLGSGVQHPLSSPCPRPSPSPRRSSVGARPPAATASSGSRRPSPSSSSWRGWRRAGRRRLRCARPGTRATAGASGTRAASRPSPRSA